MCCTSRIAINSYNPYRYPVLNRRPAKHLKPAGYTANPGPVRKSARGSSNLKMASAALGNNAAVRQLESIPIMLSVSCVATPTNPCPPGIQNPRKFQATYKPGSSTLTMLPGSAPSPIPRYLSSQAPFTVYQGPFMATTPCIPTPFAPCPVPNRQLSKPSTRKPKSRAQMPVPRPVPYGFPFGVQPVQPLAMTKPGTPYVSFLPLRYQQKHQQLLKFPQPLRFPQQFGALPQNMQSSFIQPCTPTSGKPCSPKKYADNSLQVLKVEPAQKKDNKKKAKKPDDITLNGPLQLKGDIFIHPPPGSMPASLMQRQGPFSTRPAPFTVPGPLATPCIPSPFMPCSPPMSSKKSKATKVRKVKKKENPFLGKAITLSSPLAIQGNIILDTNSPNAAPLSMIKPCVPTPFKSCPPAILPQRALPYSFAPRFQQPMGIQQPFAVRNPLAPPPGVSPFYFPKMQPPRLPIIAPPPPRFQLPVRIQHPIAGLRPLTPPLGISPFHFPKIQPPRLPILAPPPPRFQLPVGIQHPFAGLRPLTPPPGISRFNSPNMQRPRLPIPASPPVGPASSLVIQLPPIRISYPNSQTPQTPPMSLQRQPLLPTYTRMQPSAFPAYCAISCTRSPRIYCPSYCPRICCKNIVAVAKKRKVQLKKVSKPKHKKKAKHTKHSSKG